MRVDLRYGEGSLSFELDTSAEFVVSHTVDEHPNVAAELLRVLENPRDSNSFSEILSQADSVSIVVNPTENTEHDQRMLHFLLNSVETYSFNPDEVTVIYPVNPLRRTSSSEIDGLLGSPESRGHSLVLHNPKSSETLDFVGETPSYSTSVFVNNRFLQADITIGFGVIRPDVFAGATGGRMSVLPYVSGNKTVTQNARLRTMQNSRPFSLDTPSCIDMVEASQLCGLDFIVNYVSDYQGNVANIYAGNPYSSWQAGVEIAEKLSCAEFSRRADIAVVSAGGSPHDGTLYSAIDCTYAAREVTENGGAIVLVAECIDGIGPKGFLRGLSDFSSEEEVIRASDTDYEFGFEKARLFWNIISSRNLVICSRLRSSLVEEQLHCTAVRNPQDGFEAAKSMLASKRKIAIIPDGIRTVPQFKNH
ncbi:MAG: lactate racemase domain-containing protein [Promethearchaeota archaeon]